MSPNEKLLASVNSMFEQQFEMQREQSNRSIANLKEGDDEIVALKAKLNSGIEELRKNGYEFAGRTVFFAKVPRCTLRGLRIIKYAFAHFAEMHGMIVAKSATKMLDVLVVPCDELASEVAQKAARNGTRILTERQFWEIAGLVVDS